MKTITHRNESPMGRYWRIPYILNYEMTWQFVMFVMEINVCQKTHLTEMYIQYNELNYGVRKIHHTFCMERFTSVIVTITLQFSCTSLLFCFWLKRKSGWYCCLPYQHKCLFLSKGVILTSLKPECVIYFGNQILISLEYHTSYHTSSFK